MTVAEALGVRRLVGEVGIEVEVEGNNLPNEIGDRVVWKTTQDGSLRGENREFVLRKPIPRDMVGDALDILRRNLENSEVIESNRCGVHIHINCQELTLDQVLSFITTYMCFEEVLVKWCGQDRVGNLFCLRVSDAGGIINHIKRMIDTRNIHVVGTDRLRYASINLKALSTYGSLEFRSMRSDLTPGVIEKWAQMLLAIKDYSIQHQASEIISEFSVKGPQDFFNDVLGDFRADLNPKEEDMIIGMRNAQEVAFYG